MQGRRKVAEKESITVLKLRAWPDHKSFRKVYSVVRSNFGGLIKFMQFAVLNNH